LRWSAPPAATLALVLALALAGAGCASAQQTTTGTGPPTATTEGTRTPPSTVGGSGPSAVEAARAAAKVCLHADRHQYEVCAAYVANASYLARLPYYKFGHSADADLARTFRERLESRYTAAARSMIERQAAGWPGPSELDVFLPTIRIDSVQVAADLSAARLTTHETWLVRTESGHVLFEERDAAHVISLARVPGLVLHKWVVTAIR
jgi:hypothetical protein